MERYSLIQAAWVNGLVLAALLLAGCQGLNSGADGSARNRLSVHLASLEDNADLSIQEAGPDGQPLFVGAVPLITEADIRHAAATTSVDGRPALVLDLSESGAATLRAQSEEQVGRYLAVLWDGRVVYCPRLQSTLGSKLMIVGGTDVLPSDMLDEIADRINSTAPEGEEDE